MKRFFLLMATLALASAAGAQTAETKPTVFDLVGNWEGTMEFGKMKFQMLVKIEKASDGKVAAKLDLPEQGARDLPIAAMLFNSPEVRLEIDPFNTAFNGTLSAGRDQIAGKFEEGPGGRPVPMVFKRRTEPLSAELPASYAVAEGQPQDVRGYWKAAFEAMPGMQTRVGLKVGRRSDDSFKITMDLLDFGAQDIPTSSTSETNGAWTLKWQLFNAVFEGKLSDNANQWIGSWKQGGRSFPVTFERLSQPATVLPTDLSFTPKPGADDDVRGHWKGTLDTPQMKLRLAVKIGQSPDGALAGSMASLDQGGREMPMSSVSFTNPVVRFELKTIRGAFQGVLTNRGNLLEGKWEQMGNPLPLKLERTQPQSAAQ